MIPHTSIWLKLLLLVRLFAVVKRSVFVYVYLKDRDPTSWLHIILQSRLHCAGMHLSWKTYLGNTLGGFQLLCGILCKHIGDVAQSERFRPLKQESQSNGCALKPSIVWLITEYKQIFSFFIFMRDISYSKFFTVINLLKKNLCLNSVI